MLNLSKNKYYMQSRLYLIACFALFHLFSGKAQVTWEPIGGGIRDGYALSLYSSPTTGLLYVGGRYNYIDTFSFFQQNVATIDDYWVKMHANNVAGGAIYAMVEYKGKLYAGSSAFGCHSLYELGADSLWRDVAYNSFRDYSGDPCGGVRVMKKINDKLLVGGNFISVNNDTTFGVAYWDGQEFTPYWDYYPESGVTKFLVNDLALYNNQLFAAGSFDIVGQGESPPLVKFDGQKWVKAGIEGTAGIFTLDVYKGELYAGGYFYEDQGNPGSHIMKWDGQQWHKLGNGINGRVNDIMVYNDTLYACGNFTLADNQPAMYIAKWDGTNWSKIDDSFFVGEVQTMAVHDDYLYIGCGFTINGDSMHRIARRPIIMEEQKNVEDIIKIFPNPVTDNLMLEYNLDKTSNFKFALYDALGNIVYQEENPTAYGYYHYSLPTQNLAQGLYIARIELNGKTFAKKIIKQ
jgi:hypothetical protein